MNLKDPSVWCCELNWRDNILANSELWNHDIKQYTCESVLLSYVAIPTFNFGDVVLNLRIEVHVNQLPNLKTRNMEWFY